MNLCNHKVNPRHCIVCKKARQAKHPTINTLTPEQINNWRQFIATTEIGPAAYIMPTHLVVQFAQMTQTMINKISEEKPA